MISRQINPKTLPIPPFLHRLIPSSKSHFSHHAHHLFDQIPQPNAIKTSMVNYIHQNLTHKALTVFKDNLHFAADDTSTLAIAIKASVGGHSAFGSSLHAFAVSSGLISTRIVSNSLMNFYCKLGKFTEAVAIFDSMADPDVVSYNTVLTGFHNSHDALAFAAQMNSNGIVFGDFSYSTVIGHCLDPLGFLFGSQLHSMATKSGSIGEVYVGNAFITMYSRWGRIDDAEKVFDEMLVKDSVSWNAMVSGFSQDGIHGLKAVACFRDMLALGMRVDHISATAAVSACGYERDLIMGRQVHGLCVKFGFGGNVTVCNVLMSTYVKGEAREDAKRVFDEMVDRNVVSWTTLISLSEVDSLAVFREMRLDGVYPNEVTLISVLHFVTNRDLAYEGGMVHGFSVKTGFVSKMTVSSSLVTMYANFKKTEDALKAFEESQYREIMLWNPLISGYTQNGLFQEALDAFSSAVVENEPNEYTFGSVLSAIGTGEWISLTHGQKCHSHLLKLGLNTNPIVSGALLDMYAKRGSLSESRLVFQEIGQKTQVTWTTIMSAHARHGDYDSVMSLFAEMEAQGLAPDAITLLIILNACGGKGMVEMGQQIFDKYILNDKKIEAESEHYACMVDILGRAGKIKEAEDLVNRIPSGPGISALQSLLGACRIHGDLEMGQRVANALMEMEPEEASTYVQMSNMYAAKGNWEKVARLRRRMREKGVKKEIGFSWVDVGNADGCSMRMHGFSSDDVWHPRSEEIYAVAKALGVEMKVLESEE